MFKSRLIVFASLLNLNLFVDLLRHWEIIDISVPVSTPHFLPDLAICHIDRQRHELRRQTQSRELRLHDLAVHEVEESVVWRQAIEKWRVLLRVRIDQSLLYDQIGRKKTRAYRNTRISRSHIGAKIQRTVIVCPVEFPSKRFRQGMC